MLTFSWQTWPFANSLPLPAILDISLFRCPGLCRDSHAHTLVCKCQMVVRLGCFRFWGIGWPPPPPLSHQSPPTLHPILPLRPPLSPFDLWIVLMPIYVTFGQRSAVSPPPFYFFDLRLELILFLTQFFFVFFWLNVCVDVVTQFQVKQFKIKQIFVIK